MAYLYNSNPNSLLSGTSESDTLYSYGDNNTLTGGDGSDLLQSNSSTSLGSSLSGGVGDDTLDVGYSYQASNTLSGGSGRDVFKVSSKNSGVLPDIITDFTTGSSDDRLDLSNLIWSNMLSEGNPFANGYLRLLQSGNDVLLQRGNGANSTTWETQLTLKNTTKSAFTSANFLGGLDPAGGPLPNQTFTGTSGNDTLTDGYGNDTLNGGAGDDSLMATYGADSLFSGAGNDTLAVDINAAGKKILNGGDGNDYIGSESGVTATMTGGSGSDTFRISASKSNSATADIITDFQVGVGGDVLELPTIPTGGVWSFGLGGTPFNGNIHIAQKGDDAVIQALGTKWDINVSTPAWYNIAILKGVSASSITADNINGGYAPEVGGYKNPVGQSFSGQPGGQLVVGTEGDDTFNNWRGGKDTLVGGEGDDYISTSFYETFPGGAAGSASSLSGGVGNDTLEAWGGGGTTLTGGEGGDLFIPFTDNSTTPHVITDFQTGPGGDILSDGGALSSWRNGNPFSQGFLRLTQKGSDVLVEADADGSGTKSAFSGMALLKNVQKSALTAENLGGMDQNGAYPVSQLINGTTGNDNLSDVSPGDDTILGGVGNDTLMSGRGRNLLDGGEGNDVLGDNYWSPLAMPGLNTLNGGTGNDTLRSSPYRGDVTMIGGDGSDYFAPVITDTVPSATSILDFEAGIDVIDIGYLWYDIGSNGTSSPPSSSYGQGTLAAFQTGHLRLVQAGSDVLLQHCFSFATTGPAANWRDIVTIKGTNASRLTARDFTLSNDPSGLGAGTPVIYTPSGTLGTIGTSGNDTITGTNGNDYLSGLGGNDSLLGLAGKDTLLGGDGNDTLVGNGSSSLVGGTGNDLYIINSLGDRISDVRGVNTIQSDTFTNLASKLVSGINNLIYTGSGGVSIAGNSKANRIDATAATAAVSLIGGTGVDTLLGGSGNDTLVGNRSSSLVGGTGNDLYIITSIKDRISDAGGVNTVQSSVAYDLSSSQVGGFDGTIANLVYTSTRGGSLRGNNGANHISGNIGKDSLFGRNGNDTLKAFGGTGGIIQNTKFETDVMTGGAGADSFVLADANGSFYLDSGKFYPGVKSSKSEASWCGITDFTVGEDQLILSSKVWNSKGYSFKYYGDIKGDITPGVLSAFKSTTGITPSNNDILLFEGNYDPQNGGFDFIAGIRNNSGRLLTEQETQASYRLI